MNGIVGATLVLLLLLGFIACARLAFNAFHAAAQYSRPESPEMEEDEFIRCRSAKFAHAWLLVIVSSMLLVAFALLGSYVRGASLSRPLPTWLLGVGLVTLALAMSFYVDYAKKSQPPIPREPDTG